VHGNVFELARDCYTSYTDPARAGDGLRKPGSAGNRFARGGTHKLPASRPRSAARLDPNPAWQDDGLGVRPAREITD
jgi:formylglycine-generating enzyme required for sulfatase activity